MVTAFRTLPLCLALLFPSSVLATGQVLSLERRIHSEAELVEPSGDRVSSEETKHAPGGGPWVSATLAEARSGEVESVALVSTAYQRSRVLFDDARGLMMGEGWATDDVIRVPSVTGQSGSRSLFDVTFTLDFPRVLYLGGSLRTDSQNYSPGQGGAIFLLTGPEGEIFRRDVSSGPPASRDLEFSRLLEPGTYRILARANRGAGGRNHILQVGRSSFDFSLSLLARPLRLTVSPLVRSQEAAFSVRDAEPGIDVMVLATRNGVCLFSPGPPCPLNLNPPVLLIGRGMADESGSVDFVVSIPENAPLVLVHSVAAQQRSGPNGGFFTFTSPVESLISDP